MLKDDKNNALKVNLPTGVLQLFDLIKEQKLNWPLQPHKNDFVTVDGTLKWDSYRKNFYLAVSLPEHIVKVDRDVFSNHNRK